MNTLALDPTTWDLTLDSHNNMAVATGSAAIAQDVASRCRLFRGELWTDTSEGLPYFEQLLGQGYPIQLIKAELESAALLVPEVTAATAYLTDIGKGTIGGQLQTRSGTTEIITNLANL